MTEDPTILELGTLQGMFGDDYAVIREILQAYVDDLANNTSELRVAAAEQDRKRFRRAAHSMKGASGNVGALAFAALCHELEIAAAERPWAELVVAGERLTDVANALSADVRLRLISIAGA